MKNQLVWEERFNIGVELIDKEHKNLFKIINKLFEFQDDDEKERWACQEGIKFFKNHALKHFADEEEYMTSIGYSGVETHRRIHRDFQEKLLPTLERELEQSEYSAEAVEHFLGVCAGWLIGHTLIEDHAIVGNAKSQWTNMMTKEDNETMEQIICQLLHEMFRKDFRLVSESYGGEKFGKGLYYRLIYQNKQKKKWETCLVFEEKVLLNTVGKMLDVKTNTVNVLIVNAVRFTAREFVESIIKRIRPDEEYTLVSENLLTYEQFKKVYQKENPQCSLLFSSDVGYFAYCAIAPQLAESGIGTAIDPENAMKQIDTFLKKNKKENEKASQKKKILVVDDSAVVIELMKELLGETYELSFANSGLAAIRSLSLNRPDLILLDYEMPVCNGKQILEMIRAEKDLADSAVIFLTSRVDRESVQKVLSLKPAGYLSKGLKPEEIKSNIDEYFRRLG